MLWSFHPRCAQGPGPDRPEGTSVSGMVEFLHAWVPLVPIIHGVGDRCFVLFTFDPLILGTLEHLRLRLPLGVVGMAVEFAPKVCSGHWLRQTRRNQCHWSGRVPACLGPTRSHVFIVKTSLRPECVEPVCRSKTVLAVQRCGHF